MSRHLSGINLVQSELQNAVLQNLSEAPSNPKNGQIYYSTANGVKSAFIYMDDTWVNLKTITSSRISDLSTTISTAINNALTSTYKFRGTFDASAGNYAALDNSLAGYLYRVSAPGTVGGVSYNIGDDIYINKDCTDVEQVETATITVGTVVAGTITLIIVGNLVGNSPKSIELEVDNNDSALQVAAKVRTALDVADITTNYVVGGTGADVTLTAKVAANNDTSLNIALADTDTTGVNALTTSTNTTAGRTSIPLAADVNKIDNTEASDILRTGDIGSSVAAYGHNHSGTYEPANSNIQSHIGNTSNPHSVTAAQVGAATAAHTHSAATTEAAGFMSTTDKTKLDGISSGANKIEAATANGKLKVDGSDNSITVYTHPTDSYESDIGDGQNTSFVLTHNLGTRSVIVQVFDNSAPYDTIGIDVQRTSTNSVTIAGFPTAPSNNQYKVLIQKIH